MSTILRQKLEHCNLKQKVKWRRKSVKLIKLCHLSQPVSIAFPYAHFIIDGIINRGIIKFQNPWWIFGHIKYSINIPSEFKMYSLLADSLSLKLIHRTACQYYYNNLQSCTLAFHYHRSQQMEIRSLNFHCFSCRVAQCSRQMYKLGFHCIQNMQNNQIDD